MVRNDSDIIFPFLAQANALFDKLMIVDVQSTDFTGEAIRKLAANNAKIELYSIDRQEKYQSAIMNRLARAAFRQGADWVFLIDTDEFINIESREALEQYLAAFPDDVMYLPWINLVPSQYGDFASFDVSQTFYWTGRTSPFKKAALSSLFMANNPDFYIQEGNHNVCRDFASAPPEVTRVGLPLLHLPIRSLDRFKYKMLNARRTLLAKHNRLTGEGSHVLTITSLIDSAPSFGHRELNALAANYGDNDSQVDCGDPIKEEWPTIKLPKYIRVTVQGGSASIGLTETLLRDETVKWSESNFAESSLVRASIDGNRITIQPQPVYGSGRLLQGPYPTFRESNPQLLATLSPDFITDAIAASFTKIRLLTFSAWTELVPSLFCLFSLLRPRRFVELGTHNGMCFFAACQATETLGLTTQCIAIDNWIGDPHASFHTSQVFNQFASTMRAHFPNQCYIKAHFQHAADCFEDGSIDLLHIDGYHTYSAVKEDFEAWLPKMSQNGVILFHDINVHERGFGVWRFWAEVEAKYPSFSLFHCHGLGVAYVGGGPSAIGEIIFLLHNNPAYATAVRTFLQSIGQLSIEYKKCEEAAKNAPDPSVAGREPTDTRLALVPLEEVQSESRRGEPQSLLEFWQKNAAQKDVYNALERRSSPIPRRLLDRRVFQRLRYLRTIRNSKLFDAEYYVTTYPDVKKAGMDPLLHFVKHGVYELRNPNSTFNTKDYLLANRDVLLTFTNPFAHYIRFGKNENRSS
jgi:hypothetical protein